jgi:N-acetylglutamate synthase-like GNAT family acetyltransferase
MIYRFQRQWQEQLTNLVLNIQNHEFHLGLTQAQQPDLVDTENFYKDGAFWVALDKNSVIGSIGIQVLQAEIGILRKMFVHKDFRGKELGIAQQLFDTLLIEANYLKIKTIFLDTPPIAHAAHRFYERNGFVETYRDNLPQNYKFVEMPLKFYMLNISEK